MAGVGGFFCAPFLLILSAVGDATSLFVFPLPPPFFAVAVAFVDFGEVDLTLVGVAFLLLFGGDVMDLVAGEFDFCLFVAVGVVLPLETLLFFDDCCCYRQK